MTSWLILVSLLVGTHLSERGASVHEYTQPVQQPDRRVVLTFDDLPMTDGPTCDTAQIRAVTRELTDKLQARSLPAAGLVTPGRRCYSRQLLQETLRRWQAIGADIGNHTATHPDLDNTPAAAYLANIERAQRLIDDVVITNQRWFRPPYLHTGDAADTKRALLQHLAAHRYRMAPVTVDNQEWVYAAVYADARKRDDRGLASAVADGYLQHLDESMAFYERLSVSVFEREIPHVLLLHANLLNAALLDRVIALLERRGYRFVGLREALADPAYAREDTYVGPRGLSWLQRWALEDRVPIPDEPREAAWVAEEFRRVMASRD